MATLLATPPTLPPAPVRRKLPLRAFAVLAILGVLALGLRFWLHAHGHIETDNAELAGHLHLVSARVAGTVAAVLVDDDQAVVAGQPLVRLDPADADVRLAEANAALALARRKASLALAAVAVADGTARAKQLSATGSATTATATRGTLGAGVLEARAAVAQAEAQLRLARSNQARTRADGARSETLFAVGGLSQQQLEQARDAAASNEARVAQAVQALAQARAHVGQAIADAGRADAQRQAAEGDTALAGAARLQVGVSQLQAAAEGDGVAQAEALARDAALQRSYCAVLAPSSGRVGRKAVEVGQRVQPGQALLSVVEDEVWVVANFKETQVEQLKAGLPAEVTLDAFPGHPLKGHVASLSPASGAQFSLLPPDNATGNFTKVVQRVPVKIVLEPAALRALAGRLAPGMSAEVDVALAP